MPRRLLLDTSSLVYRAFFALPATITDPQQRPVNAVRGYLDMVASLIRDRAPDEVLHCLDDDYRPAPRVEAYPPYKAERAPDPDGLPWQFELLDDVLDAFGATRVLVEGWEADDAIGTLCATRDDRDEFDIVTGDRDLLQLVRDPAVRVLFTVRGVKELAVFDEAAVCEKYGVPPARYVDFAILRGDPSDGLPGVRGIGEKTARDLIRSAGSLDALLRGGGDATSRMREKLSEAGGYLAAMQRVVPVRADAELTQVRGRRNDQRLDALAAAHAIDSPVRRLREALDA